MVEQHNNTFTFRLEESHTERRRVILHRGEPPTGRRVIHRRGDLAKEMQSRRRQTCRLIHHRREVKNESRNRQLIHPTRRDQSRRFRFGTV